MPLVLPVLPVLRPELVRVRGRDGERGDDDAATRVPAVSLSLRRLELRRALALQSLVEMRKGMGGF